MAVTRYGVSPWLDAVPAKRRPGFPAFRGDITAPLVIVGGGMTGCMTAYACAAAGLKVMVLEADRLGQGGTARASGFLSSEACESYVALEARAGRRAARSLFAAARKAPRELAATVKRLKIHAGLTLADALRIVPPRLADKALRKDMAARAGIGMEVSWQAPAAIARAAAVESAGGARMRDWGFVDPYRLALGFAAAARARGAVFHEHSAVRKITFDRKRATLKLDKGSIVTEAAVICTGEPTLLQKALRRHFHFDERYTVMTEPLVPAVRKALGAERAIVCDTETPPHEIWFTPDHRVVVSGADQKRQPERLHDRTLVQRTGQLMYELTRFYPEISGARPVAGWETPLARSIDGVLYAGAHRNFPHQHLAFATLHDPARAFLASRILLRSVLGTPDKDDEHFAFARNL